ncbi:ferric reductase NAD binding domain-containing protein [Xylariaceae sp. FL0016]|nr:ferric reductase NAD binding domain-containing protein [Xylariaceae sp. FL0016]
MVSSRTVPPTPANAGLSPDISREAYFAYRTKLNTIILTHYAAYLSALIGVFVLAHWLRHIAVRLHWSRTSSRILYPFVASSRAVRRLVIRQFPGFTSVGHAVVVTIYVALNATFSFYRIDYSKSTELASRFGWMATANLVLVVFLALKNTPLAILPAYSYERLNILHQISGYATVLYCILHACIYTSYFFMEGRIHVLQEEVVTAGIVLGFAMFFSVLAGMTLRRLNYELFYIIHLVLFIVIVVTLGLHRPSFEHDKGLYATVLIGALWFLDRLIRFCRLAYNSVNNEATVHPLPNGGTQIVLKKPLIRARPGKHCYVWLPRIRAIETHPFTIIASDPMELIINTYSGFTRDLHTYASKNPGGSLKVSVEGPYGTHPDPMDFDKVVLVAGGSGATFTFGLAADMLGRMTEDSNQHIDFIWAIKGHDNLKWFTQHLNNLRSHTHASRIALKLHLTRLSATSPITPALDTLSRSISGTSVESSAISPMTPLEKSTGHPAISAPASLATLREISEKDEVKDVYIHHTSASLSSSDLPILHGRPDTESLIRAAIESVGREQRVLVAACGPAALLDVVRNTTASCVQVNGPAVELHCEQFGW